MATPTKKRPSMEPEAGETKAHEKGESPEVEQQEGNEPEEQKPALKAKHSRKRSAKNAKNTKAPQDSECGCGGKGTKAEESCDGTCGGYAKKMDRNDALTPQEYLTACELGIQNRSRGYIRARLDSAARLDLKCGAGSISEGEKCTKGTAQKAGSRVRAGLENAAILAGTAGTLFSYGQVASNAMRGNITEASKALQREGAFAALGGAGLTSKGARTNNKQLTNLGARALTTGALNAGAGHLLGGGYTKNLKAPSLGNMRAGVRNAMGRAAAATSNVTHRTAKSKFERMYNRPGRRDAVYATGFSPELDQLAL